MYALTALRLKTVVSPTVLDAFPSTRQTCIRGARVTGIGAVALVFFFTHNEICNTATRYCKPHGAGTATGAVAPIPTMDYSRDVVAATPCPGSQAAVPTALLVFHISIPARVRVRVRSHRVATLNIRCLRRSRRLLIQVPRKALLSRLMTLSFTGTVPDESSNQRPEC